MVKSKIINLSDIKKIKEEEENFKKTIRFSNIRKKLKLNEVEVPKDNKIKSMTFNK